MRTAAIDAVLRNNPALLEALVVDHMMIMVEGLMVFLHSLSVLIPTLDRNSHIEQTSREKYYGPRGSYGCWHCKV